MKKRFVYTDEDFKVMLKEVGTSKSGHFGHKGVPGHIGGSAPGEGGPAENWARNVKFSEDLQKRLNLYVNVEVVDEIDTSHEIIPVDGKVAGRYDPWTNMMTLSKSVVERPDRIDRLGFDEARSTASMGGRAVIAHEIFHAFDGGYNRSYSDSREFFKLWEKAYDEAHGVLDTSRVPSRYALTQPSEGFAEYGATYIINPTWLKGHYRKMYDYFDKLVSGSTTKEVEPSHEGEVEILIGDEYFWVKKKEE